MSTRRLPPLNALRSFEAAARHHSFSRAAKELAVTHGAVGRQVAKLEEFLGTALFERCHQQIFLTKKGASYAARLQDLFDDLQRATQDNFATHNDGNLLRIGVLPTFAMRFLVPRLAHFKEAYADIELQVDTYSPLRANDPDVDVNVAVWWGDGAWPNLVVEHLFPEILLPVGSPALLAANCPRTPDDLGPFLRLHARQRPTDWQMWLDAAGATNVDPASGLRLEYSGLVYQGAVDGLGLAMAQSIFIQDDLASGRLVPLFDLPLKTSRAYYVVTSEATAHRAKVVNFTTWLKAEVAAVMGGQSAATTG